MIVVLDVATLGLLLFAALEDFKSMQVRNVYPALFFFSSLVRVALTRPPFPMAVLSPLLLFGVLYVFWYFGGIGGADVKILSAMAIGDAMGIWFTLVVACVVFICYSLLLRKTRQPLPFIPAVVVGALGGLWFW